MKIYFHYEGNANRGFGSKNWMVGITHIKRIEFDEYCDNTENWDILRKHGVTVYDLKTKLASYCKTCGVKHEFINMYKENK